ncbi:MAG: hypothetical protein HY706_16505 [Candidatus Hydrogenedentes bacterium]|nr:hypothetical protein [Candidatus Hydrogenedentota bacterium]
MVSASAQEGITFESDPVTRYLHITYDVPSDTGDDVVADCAWSPPGKNDWRPAKVTPYISETAANMVRDAEWNRWVENGEVTERRAGGLRRTVVFNPYPEAQDDGRVDVDFRIQVRATDGSVLATHNAHLTADNMDVVYLEDWSQILQKDVISVEAPPTQRKWSWHSGLDGTARVSFGNELWGGPDPVVPLPQLTYFLDLRGWYALFVCTSPTKGGIGLRMTGDERTDYMGSRHAWEEVFWRWRRMDRQSLVLKQRHIYTGWAAAHLDYVKLVPISEAQAAEMDSQFGTPDKTVVGYYEPYSWAFWEDVQHPFQHREPLLAFAEARMSIVDVQLGRFGMKSVYETRLTDQLLYATIGDPIGDVAQPRTDNVGRMQQYTNTLETTLRHARDLGLPTHANFGASNCYLGTPLQGDFSKAHPDWLRGHHLRFEVPEVRVYALSLYRESLELGAPGLSLDYCRYPETVDVPETGNIFMRELRRLADEFSVKRGTPVPILVRFPGKGVRRWELFDYATWAREGWVDYLCPSNIQGRHQHIEIAPYLAAVEGTKCKLLPCADGLSWGLPVPGPYLWRVARLYDAGVPGIYVYQADGRVLEWPGDRRCMRMLASSEAVRRWWEADARLRPQRSKGIFISRPEDGKTYHAWERLRVWLEGIPMGEVEMYLDGQSINRSEGPPYLLGTEEYDSDHVIPPGEHQLKVRAKDGDGWLEQKFVILGA